MTRRHRIARFFKCGVQQCFPCRGYVADIWTVVRFMTAVDVAVVGILEAGHYLVYPLAEHLRLTVYHHRLPAGLFDAGLDTFDNAA